MTVSLEESRLDLLNAESVMAQIDAAQIDLLFDRLGRKCVLGSASQKAPTNCPKWIVLQRGHENILGTTCMCHLSQEKVCGLGAACSPALHG